ncbi:MAG: glycosyltransferase family 2 protein [Paracoccaceae bacterium]
MDFGIAGEHFVLSFPEITDDFHVRLMDAEANCMLALFLRQHPSGGGDSLVVNSQRPDGSWCEEFSCSRELIADGTLVLDVWPWSLNLKKDAQVILSLNPARVFGDHFVFDRVKRFETTVPQHLTSFENELNFRQFAALSQQIVMPAYEHRFGCVIIGPDEDSALLAELDASQHMLSDIRLLKASSYPSSIELEDAINASISDMDHQHILIMNLQEGDIPENIERALTQYAAKRTSTQFLLFAGNGEFALNESWAFILPQKTNGRQNIVAQAGRILVDSQFLTLAYWQAPYSWRFSDWAAFFKHSKQRLPIFERADPQLWFRPTRQTFCAVKHLSHFQENAAAQRPSGFCLQDFGGSETASVRELIWLLREEMRGSCTTRFCLIEGRDVSHPSITDWLARSTAADFASLTGKDEKPVAIAISRTVLRDALSPAFMAALTPELTQSIDAAQTSFSSALSILIDALVANGHTPFSSHIDNLNFDNQFELPDDNQLVWLFAEQDTNALLDALKQPDSQQLERFSQADFLKLTYSAIAAGSFEDIIHVASVADDLMHQGHMKTLCDTVKRLHSQLNYSQLLAFAKTLAWRNYFTEVQSVLDLMDDVRWDLSTVEAADFLELSIRVQIRDHSLTGFSEISAHALVSAYNISSTFPEGLVNALAHYRATRGNWSQIVDLFDELSSLQKLKGEIWRYTLMAHLKLGRLDGIDQLLERARSHLDAWNFNRLRMQIAAAQNNPMRLRSAVTKLLQSEEDMSPLLGAPTPFRHLSGPKEPLPKDAIACIIVARNEFTRLKWVTEYYRTLGVDRFFLIDNMSDDATLEYFAEVLDVTVLQTDENYRDSRYGVKWHNEVANTYLEGRWVLTVDADEILVFSGCETPGALRTLCARLDAEKAQALFTTMIDMYAQQGLDEVTYLPGQSLIETFNCFDRDGYWYDAVTACPGQTASGGVRTRLFWNNRHALNMPHMSMQKAPLVKWEREFRYLSSTHEMTPCKVAAETGALLHFKFLPDFHARALEEVQRQQHYEGAREYMIYAERMQNPENRSFAFEGSIQYENVDTLIELGLLKPPV